MIINKIKVISLLLWFVSSLLMAADSEPVSEPKPVDLRILIDISQESKKTFTEQEFINALQLLIDRLPDGSKAGIWTYGKHVNRLVTDQTVTAAWREEARKKLQTVKFIALQRNLVSMMRQVSFDSAVTDTDYERTILLFSGGAINLYSGDTANQLERHEVLKLLPELRQSGYVIHTMALSEQVDQRLLTTLAKETGGFAFAPKDRSSLYRDVLALSHWIVPSNYIPVQNDQVIIDKGVTAFTGFFLSLNEDNKHIIQAPNGKVTTWQPDKPYTLLRIENPAEGAWQLPVGLSPLSRIYVEGTPQLAFKGLASSYVVGQRPELQLPLTSSAQPGALNIFEASLQQQGKKLYSLPLVFSDSGKTPPVELLHSFTTPGMYQLTLASDTQNYHRAVDYPMQVYPLLAMSVSTEQTGDEKLYLLTVAPQDEDLVTSKSRLTATITDTSGESKAHTAQWNDNRQWLLSLSDDGISNEYRVQLNFTGITTSGRNINFQPKPIVIELRKPIIVAKVKENLNAGTPLADSNKSELQTASDDDSGAVSWLLIIMLVSLGLSVSLLGFYFWQNKKTKVVEQVPPVQHNTEPEPAIIAEIEQDTAEIELDDIFVEETELTNEWNQGNAEVTSQEATAEQGKQQGDDDLHIELDFNDFDVEISEEQVATNKNQNL